MRVQPRRTFSATTPQWDFSDENIAVGSTYWVLLADAIFSTKGVPHEIGGWRGG